MYRKLSLLLLLPLIASCSLMGSSPTDFTSMYTARVKESVSSIRELAKDMGYMESYKIDGMIRGALSMPGLFSGTLSTDYTAKADG